MTRFTRATGIVLLSAALAACGAGEKLDEASIADDLSDRGTRELLEETADDTYEAPEDGRLSEAQVAMYLKVREHEKQIADVARKQLEEKAKKADENKGTASLAGMVSAFSAVGSLADLATADIRAAADLGYNTAEYTWVKEQILGAAGWEMGRKNAEAMTAMMDASVAQLRKQHDEATDATTKQMFAQMLAEYEKNSKESAAQQAEVSPEDAANAFNYELISKRSDARTIFAYEWSKWTGESTEELEQKMGEHEQQVEKAVSDLQSGQ